MTRRQTVDYELASLLYHKCQYTMQEVADMIGTVNGNLSKGFRKRQIPTRKQGFETKPKPITEVTTKEERGKLFTAMNDRGISQYAIADMVRLDQSTVSKTIKAYRKKMEAEDKKEQKVENGA